MATAAPALIRRAPLAARLQPWLVATAAGLFGLVLLAFARQVAHGAIAWPTRQGLWLAMHLATVVPALPLGAWVLFGGKGTRVHKVAGRVWAVLMLVGAASSFGLTGLMGHLSSIHLLSALTVVAIPYGVRSAMTGDIARHQRTMTRVFIGLIGAGLFAFVPGRLLAVWLWG